MEYDACEIAPGQFGRSLPSESMAEYMAEYMEHYFAYRFEDYYEKVRCPVLMLPAEDDWQDERMRAVDEMCRVGRQTRRHGRCCWRATGGCMT